MDEPKDFKDIECDDIIRFCPWDGVNQNYMNGLCEGNRCEETYQKYLEAFEEGEQDG